MSDISTREPQQQQQQQQDRVAERAGRWSKEEHEAFIKALQEHGRNWELVSKSMGTRTAKQVRSHAQKHARKHGTAGRGPATPPASSPAPVQQHGAPATASQDGSHDSARAGKETKNTKKRSAQRKIRNTHEKEQSRLGVEREGAGADGGAVGGSSGGEADGGGDEGAVDGGDGGGSNKEEEGGGQEEEEEEEDGEENFIPLSAMAKPAKPSADSTSRRSLRPPWYRASSVESGYPLRTLHNEVLDLCDLLLPTPDEKLKTATALTYVKRVVAETLGDRPTVQVFGSQLTGLVLPSSDIDMVVMDAPMDAITRLGQVMYRRQNQGQVREVSVIKKAKVPIVKFVHVSSGIQVDVCFNQRSGLTSGEAAKAMMRQMQPVRPLVMVLKAYMSQRNLNETFHGGIGSFLLQLMVVALVQKCAREAKAKGYDPPTNLGYLLDEFFDFYGTQLNYASTGITLLGEGGGGFYSKQQVGWFDERNPFRLSMQNPHETVIDTASNSYKVDVCMRSFKATSLRLKCAIQRDIRASSSSSSDDSGMGEAETGGFLKYCVDPGGGLKDRVLPPPTFCTRTFDGEVLGSESVLKETLREKAKKLMKKHGGEKGKKKRDGDGDDGGGADAAGASVTKKKRRCKRKGKGKEKDKEKEKEKEKEGDDTSPSSLSPSSATSSPESCGGEVGGGSGGGGSSGKGKRKPAGSDDAGGASQRKSQGNAKKRRKGDK